MAKSLLDILFNKISESLGIGTPEWIGARGEKLTEKELKWLKLFGENGLTLKNIYVPKDNDETSEIDVIYITQKGVFVIESKNYSGWIFGSENSYYWTAMLPNKEKNKFYNPILQNKTHIKWLSEYLSDDIPMFSLIVFSERCEIKKKPEPKLDLRVIKRDRLIGNIRDIWDKAEDKLSEEQVHSIYDELKLLTNADEAVKAAHIANIKEKFVSTDIKEKDNVTAVEIVEEIINDSEQISNIKNDTESDCPEEGKICPKCGNKLVLRTAKKGNDAGKQFYGCSAFPKCRYIENR